MVLSITIHERKDGKRFAYSLLVCNEGEPVSHHIGYALKEWTYDTSVTFPLHVTRKTIASEIGINYDLPTPALLQLFSALKLEDRVENNSRKNISAGDELDLVGKVVRKIDEIDPGFFTGTPTITHIGGNEVTPRLVDRIRTIKEYNYSPQNL